MNATKEIASHSIRKNVPLVRQISILPPLDMNSECVFVNKIPMPEVPINGARIKVKAAGVCFKRNHSNMSRATLRIPSDISQLGATSRHSDVTNVFSSELQSNEQSVNLPQSTLHIPGVKDAALFGGFEVAGIIERIGKEVEGKTNDLKVGDRVIIYPYNDLPDGYSEYISVPTLDFLVSIPDTMSFDVAAMLPTGGVLGFSAAASTFEIISEAEEKSKSGLTYRILIVGTGGLALWTCRLVQYHFNKSDMKDRIIICIASLNADGIKLAQEAENVRIVEWNEISSAHNTTYEEKDLIENTIDVCDGSCDVIINFGTVTKTLVRSIRCARDGGTVLIGEDFNSVLLPKLIEYGNRNNITVAPVTFKDINCLKKLVKLITFLEVKPPPYEVFEFDEARNVVQMLCKSQVNGRAILKFKF